MNPDAKLEDSPDLTLSIVSKVSF